ncbi:AAA family ATPase [Methylomonas sp. BW4-1]|uniref:AAA family ATPase n=1 Tax=Methylomonas sp. BW4-1 TaxID=3376685 RepID=UPI004041FF84
MKINRLTLNNFRCFDIYELNLSDKFTLLIGDNGSGKTVVLDAISIITQDLLAEFSLNEISSKRTLSRNDLRYVEQKMGQTFTRELAQSTFITIDYTLDNKVFKWQHGRDTNNIFAFNKNFISLQGEDSTVNALTTRFSQRNDPLTILPIIAYYGTGRLWKKVDGSEIETLAPDSRLLGYRDCLNPASNLEQLFRWFKTQELAALQKQERRHVLEVVREAIVSMIPNAKKAWWDIDWDELMFQSINDKKSQIVPFSMLSDGYRNMIGMVADIAYRMATLNPQLEADVIKQTEGIVLIDEIDLHLHPKWQREVVGRLLNTFPKVQFVASSHSPFIIQSLYGRDDCLLWDLEKAQPIAIESESIEDIAEDQQHVEIPQKSKRYLDMMEAAEAYYRKLHEVNNESDMEVMQLRSKLDELSIPFSDDPAFAAQLKFERDSVLASKDK